MSEKQITIITLAILGVILLTGGGGVFFIKTKVIRGKEAEIGKIDAQIRKDQQKAALMVRDQKDPLSPNDPKKNKSKLEVKLADKIKEEALKTARIPDYRAADLEDKTVVDREYDAFVNQLEVMRVNTGVEFSSMRWLTPKKATGPGAAKAPKLPANVLQSSFEIVCWGAFTDLVQFLEQLERCGRHVTVDSFVLSPGRATDQEGVHSMKVTLNTFAYRSTAPISVPLPTSADVKSAEYP